MGSSTRSLKELNSNRPSEDVSSLADAIAHTRDQMGNTLEEIHGILNPGVMKEEVMKHFHDAKDGIKKELREEFAQAKDSLKAGIQETAGSLKEGIHGVKESLEQNVKAEISEVKGAIRDATIGKVETMVQGAEETAKETGRSIVKTIGENPIPVALVGVGIAWLFVNSRMKDRESTLGQYLTKAADGAKQLASGIGDKASHVVDDAQKLVGDVEGKVEDVAGSATDTVGKALTGAKSTVGNALSTAKSTVEGAAHTASNAVSRLADGAVNEASQLKTKASGVFDKNPLIVGAAVAAAGAAVGLAIPITSAEAKLMGEARDSLMTKAEEFTHQALDKVDDVAKILTSNDGGKSETSFSKQSSTDSKKGEDEPREERKVEGPNPSRGI